MPISGVVLVLHGEDCVRAEALQHLAACSDIEVGLGRIGDQVPITLEAPDASQCEELLRWVQSLAGVLDARVVYVGLEGEAPSEQAQDGEPAMDSQPEAKPCIERRGSQS